MDTRSSSSYVEDCRYAINPLILLMTNPVMACGSAWCYPHHTQAWLWHEALMLAGAVSQGCHATE